MISIKTFLPFINHDISFVTCLYINAINVKTVSNPKINTTIPIREISTKCYEHSTEICESFKSYQSMPLFVYGRENKIC